MAFATATASTPRSSACRASSAEFLPPAASATTRKRDGSRLITSIACVPIEPVEPRMTTRRGLLLGSLMSAIVPHERVADASPAGPHHVLAEMGPIICLRIAISVPGLSDAVVDIKPLDDDGDVR